MSYLCQGLKNQRGQVRNRQSGGYFYYIGYIQDNTEEVESYCHGPTFSGWWWGGGGGGVGRYICTSMYTT